MDQSINILSPSIYLFPLELVGIGCCASIATATTDENFTIVSGCPRDFAGGKANAKDGWRHDGCFTIDRGQRVDVP